MIILHAAIAQSCARAQELAAQGSRSGCFFAFFGGGARLSDTMKKDCPLEGYRADPGKILSHVPSLKSGDHVPPYDLMLIFFGSSFLYYEKGLSTGRLPGGS